MQIENMYLSHNRPGTIRSKTTAIAVHWVGNPGTSAKANRNYFQNTDRSVSSNYIVGLDGEIICCIPDNEISWWLYEDVEKIIYIKKNGKEKKIPVQDIYIVFGSI